MGWTEYMDNPELSRVEMIRRELSQAPTADNPRAWGFEYMTERGSTVYAVGWSDAPDRPRYYFGLVCLTSRRNGLFAYKDMTEDMGPYKYDAPARMLDMLDKLAPNPPGQYAAGWRQACRDRIAAKKARTVWQAGDRVQYGREAYTLKRPAGPRKGWIVTHHSGMDYRLPARALSNARRLEPDAEPFRPTKQVSAAEIIRGTHAATN